MSRDSLPEFTIEKKELEKRLSVEYLGGGNILLKISSGNRSSYQMVDWITITEKELDLIGSFCESQSYTSRTNRAKHKHVTVEVREVDSSGVISVKRDYFDDLESAKSFADVLIAMKKNHKIVEADGDYTLLKDRESGDELTINISRTR